MIKFVRLGEACLVRRGTTITRKQTQKGNVPVIAGGKKATYFHNKHNRESGAITVSGSGASAGLVNYWSIPIFASDCSTVELKDNKQNVKFIYYYMQSMQEFIYKNMRSGAAQPHVYAKDIANLNFPLFSLEEQQRIVAKLDEAFAEIDKEVEITNNLIAKYKLIFERCIREHFLIKNNNTKVMKLSDVAEYFNGLTYSPKDVSENGTIVLRSSNIQNGKMEYTDIVRVKKKIKDKLYVRPQDILICSRNGSKSLIGKSSIIGKHDEPMTFGTFMMIVRSEANNYLQWFFKSEMFKQQISKGENTAINQITRYMLDEVVLPFFEEEKQIEFSKKLNALDTQIRYLIDIRQKKIKNLYKLKSALLKQELQVREAA